MKNHTRLFQALGAGLLLALCLPATAGAADSSEGCGRISTFDTAPRQQHLHAATVISIDGELPGPSNADAWRVKPGPHVLKVTERIESKYLSFNDRLRNSGEQQKTLKVDVPANTTLMVAARLDPEHSNEWQNGAYWEPVVWKEIAERCR